MKLKSSQLCDDWGWFIDVESNYFAGNISLQPCRSPIKKFNSYLNKLPKIEEDEYEYYQKNYKDPEEIIYKEEVELNYDISLKSLNKNEVNTIFNVGSTTLITAVLTYVIFIIL
jgi:hypothetical protein